MNLAILSDTRLPTLPDGGHGLGRSAHDIASGLAARGHTVTLFAAYGSQFNSGHLCEYKDEVICANDLNRQGAVFDAILDTSHSHHLSKLRRGWPVVNRIGDRECAWQPPNAVVNSTYMQRKHPNGRLVHTGINVEAIPFFPEHQGYLAFMSAHFAHKGWPEVQSIARKADMPLRIIENLTGAEKWEALGGAVALLHPSTLDAAPRSPLEAAACGVPTLCLSGDGCSQHVVNGRTGFVADDVSWLPALCTNAWILDRTLVREWVTETHGYEQMIDGYESLLTAVANGERW